MAEDGSIAYSFLLPANVTPRCYPAMSFTIRAVLISSRLNKSGKCPVKICLTVRGIRTYKSTGIRISPKDWDEKEMQVRRSAVNWNIYNIKIRQRINELDNELNQKEITGTAVTISSARSIIHGIDGRKSIYEYGMELIISSRSKYSKETLQSWENELNRIERYQPGITFIDVNPAFLRKYENWLRTDESLANNTVHKCWRVIKRVFNKAIREGIATDYPFAKYDDAPKYKQTDRPFLYIQEVYRIHEILSLPLKPYHLTTACYFLLGCYSGLRYVDWARFDYNKWVQGNRLILRAKKNGELVSWEMHSRLRAIVERLKDLPPIYSEPVTNSFLKQVGKIAGIDKPLTTHMGRHSFAVHCAELEIPPAETAELMGITLKTVMVYYKIVNKKLDAQAGKWDQ